MPAVIGDARRGIKALKREADDRADLYAAVAEIERLGGLDRAIAAIEDRTKLVQSEAVAAEEKARYQAEQIEREIADLENKRRQAEHAKNEAVDQANEAAKLARDQATSVVANARAEAERIVEAARAQGTELAGTAQEAVNKLEANRQALLEELADLAESVEANRKRKAEIEVEIDRLKARLG